MKKIFLVLMVFFLLGCESGLMYCPPKAPYYSPLVGCTSVGPAEFFWWVLVFAFCAWMVWVFVSIQKNTRRVAEVSEEVRNLLAKQNKILEEGSEEEEN